MQTYAIAFISFFENDLQVRLVAAQNEVEALRLAGGFLGYSFGGQTLEAIAQEATDADCAIAAKVLPCSP